ncbi:hypothetical protein [Klebsiella sp. WP4-W18-ESBL-05]|uniref:hypothetical protein n=1 Tax=Klebsiella sp. WP4-W18-ESBL-05 TaxID=2675713 RepID=UPI0015DCA74C|nr:hypothetical protein [Klebsiella sp. WP4-W18-ESBL-05]BBR58911.1 hypothetical protein WP4W18E05_22790 [Klebsiella sp. WP4-W18-ESBL-05]
MSITLENGRINMDSLETIEDCLRGLALANRTLDSIKEQLRKHSDKESEWYIRATTAHKSWFWCRSRIREQLAVLRRQEKEVNRLLWQYENDALLEQLKSRVSSDVFSECMRRAKLKAAEQLARAIAGIQVIEGEQKNG